MWFLKGTLTQIKNLQCYDIFNIKTKLKTFALHLWKNLLHFSHTHIYDFCLQKKPECDNLM